MGRNQRPYQLHLFTLRLWREALNEGQFEWRGELRNTSTGEVRYFRDWQILVRLLPAMLAEPDANDTLDSS